jgi:hypothetical protein
MIAPYSSPRRTFILAILMKAFASANLSEVAIESMTAFGEAAFFWSALPVRPALPRRRDWGDVLQSSCPDPVHAFSYFGSPEKRSRRRRL